VQVNITNLIDDVQCYQTVRELRWLDGVQCPSCESQHVIKRGFDDTEPARQRYECHPCGKRFDELNDTILSPPDPNKSACGLLNRVRARGRPQSYRAD
jgi:transposase-like protein